MLATCSVDKTVTLWDTYNSTETPTTGPPRACGNKDMSVGKLYTVNFYPSSPWLIGCAGGGKEIAIWDMTRDAPVQKRFASRIGIEPVLEELEENAKNDKEAFVAMMSAPPPMAKVPMKDGLAEKNTKKKGDGKKKNKAHKARR